MVIKFLILLFTVPVIAFEAKLATECSKQEIFAGETTLCQFTIFSDQPILEVEVAKFPEFRGYWSENVHLRQGYLGLSNHLKGRFPYKSLVGAYNLTPMVRGGTVSIHPMKLVVRERLNGDHREIVILSEPPRLTIKPLPAPPAPETISLVDDAVGTLSVQVDKTEIPFQQHQPSVMRIVISGEGNFQEINRVRILEHPSIKVLSQKTSNYGMIPNYSKVIEIKLAVDTNDELVPFALPPFIFFDPGEKKWVRKDLPPIRLRREKIQREIVYASDASVNDLIRHWTIYTPLHKKPGFWWPQIVLAMVGLCWLIVEKLNFYRSTNTHETGLQNSLRLDLAKQAFTSQDWDTFLRLLDELAFDVLACRVRIAPGTSRSRALRLSHAYFDTTLLSAIRTIFLARACFAYSEEKTLTAPVSELAEAFTTIAGHLETDSKTQRKSFLKAS